MGVVYKARDPVLDRVVAIKTINLTLPKDELAEYEARFYQEARAAGGLNHPNIVTIYDIGKSERVAYMAMEFLEGQELRSAARPTREPLPVEQALDIAAQVADGLAYAHDRHIVHRDIKPANIMVVRDGLVKITDFGIARMRTNEVKTMTGMILGSPKYMSPEQVAGKRADHRSDLFSLGVVLYEMLTGQSPFQADNIHGIMYQIMKFTPPPPSTRNPVLPDVVDSDRRQGAEQERRGALPEGQGSGSRSARVPQPRCSASRSGPAHLADRQPRSAAGAHRDTRRNDRAGRRVKAAPSRSALRSRKPRAWPVEGVRLARRHHEARCPDRHAEREPHKSFGQAGPPEDRRALKALRRGGSRAARRPPGETTHRGRPRHARSSAAQRDLPAASSG